MIDLTRWTVVSRRTAQFTGVSPEHQERVRRDYMPLIKQFAGDDVEPDDVIIRGMRIVNSQRDYYFSRFTLPALNEIAALLPGRPVMRAHDYYTGLPEGMTFAAQRVTVPRPKTPRRDSYWVESLFYMPNDEAGQAAARRIDLGVWREVSLGWRSLADTCSLCGNDIRTMDCPHFPGEVYSDGLCEYDMSGVTMVLEQSFVFAGGQKETTTFNPARAAPDDDVLAERTITTAQLAAAKRAMVQGAPDSFVEDILRVTPGANEPLRRNVQTVTCSKEGFVNRDAAARYVRDLSFRADMPQDVDESSVWAFRQFDTQAVPGSERKITLDKERGVKAVVVQRADKEASERSLSSLFTAA